MTREKTGGDCFPPFHSSSSPASGPPVRSRKGVSPADCGVEKTRMPFSSLSPLYSDSSHSSTSPLWTSSPEPTSSATSAPVSSLSSASVVFSSSPHSSSQASSSPHSDVSHSASSRSFLPHSTLSYSYASSPLSSSSHLPASTHPPSSTSSSSPSSLFCVCSDTLRQLKETSEAAAAVGQSAASLVEKLYALALERDALEEAEKQPVQSPKRKNEAVEEETEAHAPEDGDVLLSSADHLVVSRLEPMLLSLQSLLNRENEVACRGQEVVGVLEASLRLHLQSDASFFDTRRTERKQSNQGEGHTHRIPRDAGAPPSPLTRHASSSFSPASCSSSASPSSSASMFVSPAPVGDAQEGAKSESEKARVQLDRAMREKEAVCSVLVLCHRLAASLEEAVQFRQSVKEELTHFASAETFRAAKIAFAAEPFVWEQRDILLKARECLDAWTLFRARSEGEPREDRSA